MFWEFWLIVDLCLFAGWSASWLYFKPIEMVPSCGICKVWMWRFHWYNETLWRLRRYIGKLDLPYLLHCKIFCEMYTWMLTHVRGFWNYWTVLLLWVTGSLQSICEPAHVITCTCVRAQNCYEFFGLVCLVLCLWPVSGFGSKQLKTSYVVGIAVTFYKMINNDPTIQKFL